MDRAFSPEETRRILHEPPYWSFCWASGLALAHYLAANPEWVAGKRVLDFGAGSGVAAVLSTAATAWRHKHPAARHDGGKKLYASHQLTPGPERNTWVSGFDVAI